MTINQRVAHFFRVKKITQTEFSDKTGYSRGNIVNIIQGKTAVPKIDLVQAFLIYYPEINIRWLLLGEEPMILEENYQTTEKLYIQALGKKEIALIKAQKQTDETIMKQKKNLADYEAQMKELEGVMNKHLAELKKQKIPHNENLKKMLAQLKEYKKKITELKEKEIT